MNLISLFKLLEQTMSYPKEITPNELIQYVIKWHRRTQDFENGDLNFRIWKFTKYVLTQLPISELDMEEWQVDDEYVDEYARMDIRTMPPIVYDADLETMIDGMHRVNAVARQGGTHILAYVGTSDNIDPDFDMDFEE